ncbi:MAG: hypothetical protein HY453_01465 [Parcubacteria group bacterium]|nr:hypothetical protein [Parcubacteria group bacterium]
MFEQLFGSKTRFELLKIFFENPDTPFFIRELTRLTDSQINAIRRELQKLESLGMICVVENQKKVQKDSAGVKEKKYYCADPSFLLFHEFKDLISKSKLLDEKHFYDELKSVGDILYLAVSGIFVKTPASTDILCIGKVDKEAFSQIVANMEKKLDVEIRYTIMDPDEYQYRKEVSDRFIHDFLSSRQMVLLDKRNEA